MSDEPTTFYWVRDASIQPDGTLSMRATGYDGSAFWTGSHRVPPDDSDHELWRALRDLMRARPQAPAYLTALQLHTLREQFHNHGSIHLPCA